MAKIAEQSEEYKRIQEELARLKAEAALKEQLGKTESTAVVVTPEPEIIAAPQLSNPSGLAVFPIVTNRSCYLPRDVELIQALERLIKNERLLLLTYSYYWDDAVHTSLGAAKNLWTGTMISKTPNFEQVYRIGEKMDLDGVLMAWMKCGHSDKLDDSGFPFDI